MFREAVVLGLAGRFALLRRRFLVAGRGLEFRPVVAPCGGFLFAETEEVAHRGGGVGHLYPQTNMSV